MYIPFQIVRNDITKMRVDSIVNTANLMLRYVTGIDSAVYEAAGKDKLLAKCHEIGPIVRGTSVITDAYNFPIHYSYSGNGVTSGKACGEDIIINCYLSVFDGLYNI